MKQFSVYELVNFTVDIERMSGMVSTHAFEASLPSVVTDAVGFISPCPSRPDEWLMPCGSYHLGRVLIEKKVIPADEVKRRLNTKVEHIMTHEKRHVTRKERSDIKDEIVSDMAPQAFKTHQHCYFMIDAERGKLIVCSASKGMVDTVLDKLRDAFGSLPAMPFAGVHNMHSLKLMSFCREGEANGFIFDDTKKVKVKSSEGDGNITASMMMIDESRWLGVEKVEQASFFHPKLNIDISIDKDFVVHKFAFTDDDTLPSDIDDEYEWLSATACLHANYVEKAMELLKEA